MLDFWMPAGALDLVVYAHSIDFGAKGYGNLVQLAAIQHEIARRLAAPVGSLSFIIKSAHIYDTELEYMQNVEDSA
jgi:thymidylate synthase